MIARALARASSKSQRDSSWNQIGRRSKRTQPTGVKMPAVYLLHLSRDYDPDRGRNLNGDKRHYVGYYHQDDPSPRIARHGTPKGAKRMSSAFARGVTWEVAHVWSGPEITSEDEVRIQREAGFERYCKFCRESHEETESNSGTTKDSTKEPSYAWTRNEVKENDYTALAKLMQEGLSHGRLSRQ